jgi:hypothetical protein
MKSCQHSRPAARVRSKPSGDYSPRVATSGSAGRSYDISPDGQRFLMLTQGGGADQTAAPPSLIVVQHWTEELKRLVPTK